MSKFEISNQPTNLIGDNPYFYTSNLSRNVSEETSIYSRIENVPYSDNFLFSTDYRYPNSNPDLPPSKKFFRMSYIDMFRYMIRIPYENRTFYECIYSFNRKPYFDIEYEFALNDAENAIMRFDSLINYVREGIKLEFESKGINYVSERDLIMWQSHGATKRSCHIVINNLYVTDFDVQRPSNVIY